MSDLRSIISMDPVRQLLLISGYARENSSNRSLHRLSTDLLRSLKAWIPIIYEKYDSFVTMDIDIVRAIDLKRVDLIGRNDPYATVKCLNRKIQNYRNEEKS